MPRGQFSTMDRSRLLEIASKGGKSAHQRGTAHEWTSEEAREAARKGAITRARKAAKALVTATVLVLGFASTGLAQSIDKWPLRIYNTGAPSPLSTTDLLAANVVCNQVDPGGTAVNPNKVVFDDVSNAGKVCIWTDPGTGPLSTVPIGGSYEATLAAVNVGGSSAESARVPFTRPGPPSVPTGVRLRR